MKKDIVEKGAILQRDRETYGIAPPFPPLSCLQSDLHMPPLYLHKPVPFRGTMF